MTAQYERAKAASNPSKSYQHKQKLLADVAQSSTQLLEQLASMRNLQETLIVPAIARVVPSKVQKSFSCSREKEKNVIHTAHASAVQLKTVVSFAR